MKPTRLTKTDSQGNFAFSGKGPKRPETELYCPPRFVMFCQHREIEQSHFGRRFFWKWSARPFERGGWFCFPLEASSVGGNLVKEVFKSGIPRLCLGSPPELLLCVSCLFLCILCSDEETLPRSSVHFALSGHLYMFPSPHHSPASGPGM